MKNVESRKMEDNKRAIVRTYRIVVDDESVYSLQKKYFYPRNTEKMPTVEKDVFSILSEPYLAITENIFIPTNKIKKIKNRLKLKLSIPTPFLVGNQPEV